MSLGGDVSHVAASSVTSAESLSAASLSVSLAVCDVGHVASYAIYDADGRSNGGREMHRISAKGEQEGFC